MSDTKEFNAPELVREYGVRQLKAEYIVQGYREAIDPAQIPGWEDAASAIIVNSEEQREDMEAARELRLLVRQSRITVEKTRKELKDDALRESKAIDGLGRMIRERLEAVEDHLKAQEEFAKRAEEERERIRREEAERLLREKEEREAREREEARLLEERRIREENDRLRRENEQREKELAEERAKQAAERKAAEEKARKEQEERERAEAARLEAERIEREKRDREEKARQERERKKHEKELEEARAEAERLAALVKCPKCGHEFDGREAGA